MKIILDEYIISHDKPQKTAIREAIERRLSTITQANGYWCDVAVYDYQKRSYNDEDVQHPYIEVYPSEISLANAMPDSIQMTNALIIRGVVKIKSEDDYLLQLEKLEEDILRCLYPKKIGMQSGAYNTLNCDLTSVYYEERESGSREASINFIISFNTSIQTKKETKL